MISLTYTEFSTSSTIESVKDNGSVSMERSYGAPSKIKAKTPARESNSVVVEEMLCSPGAHLLEEPPVAHSSPLATEEDEAE